jgi:hypothetical protein
MLALTALYAMNAEGKVYPAMTPPPILLPNPYLLKAVGGLGSPPPPIAAVLGLFPTPMSMADEPSEIFLREFVRPLMLTF